jgi:hypothetical protein
VARGDLFDVIGNLPDKAGRPLPPGTTRPVVPQPGDGRDPGSKPGDPPGREFPDGVGPRPVDPGDKPGRPLPPGVKPPPPIPKPGEERPDPPVTPPPEDTKGTPEPPITPTPPGEGPGEFGSFDKGQPYQDVDSKSGPPPAEDFYGSGRGFDPYFGKNRGQPTGATGATDYDPLGIGRDAYTDPNADVWSMEGVNSVLRPPLGSNPRMGIVGGQGGYGIGMVSQDYSGPLFDDPQEIRKTIRKQRRQLNQATRARRVADPVATPAAGTPATPTTPAAGGEMYDWKGNPATGGAGAGGGAGTGATAGQKPGQPPPSDAGTPAPSTGALGNALSTTGNYNSAATAPGSETMAGFYDTPFGRVTQSSGGHAGVFKKQGGGEGDADSLYHFDPTAGWKHMTGAERRGYGDYNYADPSQIKNDPRVGAVKQQFQRTSVPASMRGPGIR